MRQCAEVAARPRSDVPDDPGRRCRVVVDWVLRAIPFPRAMEVVMNGSRIVPGAILVALGTLFLLDALDVLAAGATLARWWPLAIVLLGLARLLDRPRDLVGGGITALAGLVLLAWTLGIVEASVFALLWPLVLVVVGLRLLLSRNSVPRGRSEDDTVSAAVLFSGRELTSFSHRFAGGSLFAAFGGIDLDLTNARPQPGGATIMVTALFGGTTITVPRGWRVAMSGPAIFGGYENGAAKEPVADDAPAIDVRVLTLFGGAEVKLGATMPVAPVEP
jgi:predicted membrane protein